MGYTMRNSQRCQIHQFILQGKFEDTRSVGKRRIFWLKNLHNSYLKVGVAVTTLKDGVGAIVNYAGIYI